MCKLNWWINKMLANFDNSFGAREDDKRMFMVGIVTDCNETVWCRAK